MMPVPRQAGFTLLEVLVVVALIALTAAILVPALLRVDTSSQVKAVDKLATTLTELSERSLFLGQITALRLDAHGYTPLIYVIETESFQPFTEANLSAQQLPEELNLSWQADDARLSQQLQTGMSRQAPEADAESRESRESHESGEGRETSEAIKQLPQIFFLPGGQASAGLLRLSDANGHSTSLQIDALGRVQRLDEAATTAKDTKLPPLILPDDASFYQPRAR